MARRRGGGLYRQSSAHHTTDQVQRGGAKIANRRRRRRSAARRRREAIAKAGLVGGGLLLVVLVVFWSSVWLYLVAVAAVGCVAALAWWLWRTDRLLRSRDRGGRQQEAVKAGHRTIRLDGAVTSGPRLSGSGGPVRCVHPPELCTSEGGVTACRCGARISADYRALGGAALDIAERRSDPPTRRTNATTGTLTLGGTKRKDEAAPGISAARTQSTGLPSRPRADAPSFRVGSASARRHRDGLRAGAALWRQQWTTSYHRPGAPPASRSCSRRRPIAGFGRRASATSTRRPPAPRTEPRRTTRRPLDLITPRARGLGAHAGPRA